MGCAQGPETGTADTTTSAPEDRTAPAEESTVGNDPAEPEEAAFIAAPTMSGGTEGTADGLLGVGFEAHEEEGFERAVLTFGSGGAPGERVPAWTLSSLTGEGYARLSLPGVATTQVSDAPFDGSILDDLYVIRSPGGGVFLALFATGAFRYRATTLSDPARLVVDYRPADVPFEIPLPARTARTVLSEHARGRR